MTTASDKYLVFRTEDFTEIWKRRGDGEIPSGLEDAVVIRKSDLFAGPALHTYSSNISLVVKLLKQHGLSEEANDLLEVADYFHGCAIDADDMGYKLPD